jgi:hypothetical protein
MKLTCYYCPWITNTLSVYCPDCAKKYNLKHVITFYHLRNQTVDSVHLFTQTGIWIKLFLQDNKTQIDAINFHLEVPGFPITPVNAHHKIKLYLTFS